jgi:hypothetical protein
MPRGVPKAGFRVTKNRVGNPQFMIGDDDIDLEPPASDFSVIERFEFIRKFVSLVAERKINSFVLTGSGGIGKTTAVMETLKSVGLREDTPDSTTGDFIVIRGFSTPRALYETMYEYKNKILVLDDADQVFKDPLGANLIKAALDDKPTRIINWNTSREPEDGVPNRFIYSGRMIFVSNLSINQFPQAIISRSQKVDVTLNTDEKVDIISEVFKKLDKNEKHKSDILEFVKDNARKAKDLNIRSAVALFTLRENFGDDWKRIAEYSFSN